MKYCYNTILDTTENKSTLQNKLTYQTKFKGLPKILKERKKWKGEKIAKIV